MAAPTMTSPFNTEGNAKASGSLAANTSATFDIDVTTSFECQLVVDNTPGGTVSATRGLQIDILLGYGTTPTYSTIPDQSYTLPSAVASTLESVPFHLGTGKYRIKLTNLDGTNAVTTRATAEFVTSVA